MSLAKEYRLGKDFFRKPTKKEKSIKGKFLNVAVHKPPLGSFAPKYGIVVSSKNIPRAVNRNKIKRRIRAHIEKWDKNQNKWYVFYFKNKNAPNKKELEEDVLNLLKKIRS